MSKIRNMVKIYVATANSAIRRNVQKLLPSEDVVGVDVDPSGKVSTEDKISIEQTAEVLLADTPVIIDVARTARKLKWAASTWAGVEPLIKHIDHRKPPPFAITRMGGAYGDIMAEFVLGYILAKERNIIDLAREQDKHNWDRPKYSNYRELRGITVGILGVGEIGKVVAYKCNVLGMRVIGVTRTIPDDDKKCPAVTEYRGLTDLPDVLEGSDYIVNVLPSTPDTKGLLSGDIFSYCEGRKSVFINIGRGDITDENTIVKAVSMGWLGGAVLDVFKEEPLPQTSPLWSLPGVIVTPHVGGVCVPSLIARAFVENYNRFIENKPLQFVLDFKKGY